MPVRRHAPGGASALRGSSGPLACPWEARERFGDVNPWRTRGRRRSGRRCRPARTDARRNARSASANRTRRTPRRRWGQAAGHQPPQPAPGTRSISGLTAISTSQPMARYSPVEMAGRFSRLLAFSPTPSRARPQTRPNNVQPQGSRSAARRGVGAGDQQVDGRVVQHVEQALGAVQRQGRGRWWTPGTAAPWSRRRWRRRR